VTESKNKNRKPILIGLSLSKAHLDLQSNTSTSYEKRLKVNINPFFQAQQALSYRGCSKYSISAIASDPLAKT